MGGIHSLAESRDDQCTLQNWTLIPFVLLFRVVFSAVSVGYCLVFLRGLQYLLRFVLKFPPVNLFSNTRVWCNGMRLRMKLKGFLAFVSLHFELPKGFLPFLNCLLCNFSIPCFYYTIIRSSAVFIVCSNLSCVKQ